MIRTLDNLASFGSGTADGHRLLTGRRGWIVRCEIDLADGSAPRVDRTCVTRQQRAEEIASAILHRARTGDEVDDLLRYIREDDPART